MSNNFNRVGKGAVKRGRRGRPVDDVEMTNGSRPKTGIDSPVARTFLQFQVELDRRHDKYERLVKISRDITIESKRIIFLLHRIESDESAQTVVDEVQQKLYELENTRWHQVAVELRDEDPYQFLRAYSPGLQEYIEALSFLHYVKHHTLLSLEQVKEVLTFMEKTSDDKSHDLSDESVVTMAETEATTESGAAAAADSASPNQVRDEPMKETLSVHVPPTEYMLGLADLTGELMRMAIGCIGRGDLSRPFELCRFIQSVHSAFLSFGNVSRDLSSKLWVLRQSMRKVEDACYAVQVRGSEMPKHLLADVVTSVRLYEANDDVCSDYAE